MNLVFSKVFIKKYNKIQKPLKDIADKQLYFLSSNIKHPSLRVKKLKGHKNLWEARINKNYRVTYIKFSNCYFLRSIGPHDVIKKP